MSPRPYTLGKREAAVQETRARIIEATRALIVEAGFHRASLGDVATRADVTRATVYYQFGSKLGLLVAVIDDLLRRVGNERMGELIRLPDARVALHESLRVATQQYVAEHEMYRNLLGLAAVDPEARAEIEQRDSWRLMGIGVLAKRLAEEGYLREGCDEARTRAVLTVLSSFPAFDSLFTTSALPPAAVADTLIEMTSVVVRTELPLPSQAGYPLGGGLGG